MSLYIDENLCPQNHRCPMMPACPVEAISQLTINSLPIIDTEKCIECGHCSEICGKMAVRER